MSWQTSLHPTHLYDIVYLAELCIVKEHTHHAFVPQMVADVHEFGSRTGYVGGVLAGELDEGKCESRRPYTVLTLHIESDREVCFGVLQAKILRAQPEVHC